MKKTQQQSLALLKFCESKIFNEVTYEIFFQCIEESIEGLNNALPVS
jgi:hypothetical protein